MLTLPGHARIFLCKHPIHMGKSFNGLSVEVEKLYPSELLTGAFFVFLNRRKNHMKVLFWDKDGFVIYFKRLEKGSFRWKGEEERLDRKTFFMLLEGITPKKIQSRFSL